MEDQGQLASCTSQALVGALEFLEIKAGAKFADLSRLFVYYNERDLENTLSEDSGAQLRDGIKVLAKLGVCKESLWLYDIKRFADKPTDDCYTKASDHTITAYQRISTLTDMKACLAGGLPFVFGFDVFKSAMTDAVALTGDIPMPSRWERMMGAEGGHAIMAVGYDDAKKVIIFRNSWGKGWGKMGYGSLSYAYIQKYASDFWCIQKNKSSLYTMLKQQEMAV